jgi:adenine-specific DNA-methyltransferase
MAKQPTKIDAHTHPSATRKNIPTSELQSFVTKEEAAPKDILYPRDTELDPQLVWRGKDAQDREGLTVPAVPIYIQEKIHPQAIIADLKRRSDLAREEAEEAEEGFVPDLFADFNGLPDPEAVMEFYEHDAHWSNRMILGDSLLVMNSLAEKEAMRGKIQCIYLDPPYGIKFNSNWQPSTKSRNVKDGNVASLTREPEMVRAFRDTWSDGIHSYLSYLRDRLVVARDLLTDSGSIFVQIGDENVHVVRSLMDEVFGAENFAGQITLKTTGGLGSSGLKSVTDFLIWYAKSKDDIKFAKPLLVKRQGEGETTGARYDNGYDSENQVYRTLTKDEKDDPLVIPDTLRTFQYGDLVSSGFTATCIFPQKFEGRSFEVKSGRSWKTNREGINRLIKGSRIGCTGKSIRYRRYLDDYPAYEANNIWENMVIRGDKQYIVETSTSAIERCILMTTDPGDLVLDPTCGSGTTAYVAEQWGRRWITIDTSRVALALARQRLMAGRFPGYMLNDTTEGIKKEAELTGKNPDAERLAVARKPSHRPSIRRGFVLERVPHITLKSIANNSEIDTIWDAHQETLETLLTAINDAKQETWEEWQVPRDPANSWPDAAQKEHAKVLKAVADEKKPDTPLKKLNGLMKRDYSVKTLPEKPQDDWTDKEAIRLHDEWWTARRARQEEIDASISRNADTEYLVDKPFPVPNRARVTGPFTVESLSPHRVLPTEEEADRQTYEDITGEEAPNRTRSLRREKEARAEGDFITVVLSNLKASGVQNTKKNERLEFTELRPYAGTPLIAAEARYMEGDTEKRAAVVIGPEYGTVGWGLVRDAAREAVEMFDTMIVCGFAFSPDVSEDRFARLGGLTVLKARMNNDLHMAEALKNTGAGNLFVVFGEPEVNVKEEGGRLRVEITGVDVFDPTTGEVRSSGVDDIACWFIDTDYNAESFFVRHAYFLGGNDPYAKLKTTLKSEIDEEAWDSLYSSVSRPFDIGT